VNLKIWIDLTNSPHVNFFAEIIRELSRNHEVIATCRPLANTIDLLDIEGFSYTVVGRHYGACKAKKILGFPVRVFQLWRFLKKQKIDVAISHSSFYSPLVSKLLGLPSVYLNDNEHAKGNHLAFAFANRILIPEFLNVMKVAKGKRVQQKFVQYPGVKEGVYLWYFRPEKRADSPLGRIGLADDRKTICIRPEPWTAQYYQGKVDFLDGLICDLANDFNVVILPRGGDQTVHYLGEKFSKAFVLRESVKLDDIVARCDLFIGAGGTMTREAAVLGVPTISVYQDELLEVDRYLIRQGDMAHCMIPDRDFVQNFLESKQRGKANAELLEKGEAAYRMIIDVILGLGVQCKKSIR
jgi:hypothetical protein